MKIPKITVPRVQTLRLEGTVYRGNSGNYSIRVSGDATEYVARLRGNLKKEFTYSTSGSQPHRVVTAKKRRSTDPIAVGDIVRFDPEEHWIEAVLPRRSELARSSPTTKEQHVLVANLDLVSVMFAAASPQPDLWLLDRFLVLVEAADLRAQIIVNKLDLVTDLEPLRVLFAPYVHAGYPVHYLSARASFGIEELRATLKGTISAFTGPSGVGKSSLLNTLMPGLKLKTGDVGEITYKGRHTTTTAELIPLDIEGTWIADTPGLRQLDFWDIDKDEIADCFPEFKPYAGQCQFSDCYHHQEPGCQVRIASEMGEIDARRYKSFLQMSQERAEEWE